MTLLDSIRAKARDLSRSQQVAARYFAEHWEEIAYMSTSEIAARTGLSQATIVRSAASLGFKGFVDMQESFRGLIQQTLSTVNRLDRLGELGNGPRGREKALATKVFDQLADNLQKTYQKVQPATVSSAVKALLGAKRILVVGMRSSAAAAHYLGFNLSMVAPDVHTALSDFGLTERLSGIGSQDAVVVIAFPRYTRLAIHAARVAKEKGAVLIAITDTPASPLAVLADLTLFATPTSSFYNHSLVAIMAVIDLLLAQLVRANAAPIRKSLERLELELNQLGVFET